MRHTDIIAVCNILLDLHYGRMPDIEKLSFTARRALLRILTRMVEELE